MAEKIKPKEKALITESDLSQMKEDIRNQLIETEIEPLKERLNIAINSVQSSAIDIKKSTFLAPTKEQVMNMIAPGCKDEKILSLFIETCKHLQLDPIKREIYLYNQGGIDWVIKVDYKVPLAIAQRDPDYMHFKSWVEYLPEDKKHSEKLNPENIHGAYCRIYKRSWVKLAHQTDNPELAYKEHFVPWNTWRRTKKDGNLFSTWRDKGHFYIEKTAIDHCFRLVYSELLGALPPSAGYDMVEEEDQTVEAEIIKNHKKKKYEENKPKVDSDFSKAPAVIEENSREPKGKTKKDEASEWQINLIARLLKDENLPDSIRDKCDKAVKQGLTVAEATKWIGELGKAIKKTKEPTMF